MKLTFLLLVASLAATSALAQVNRGSQGVYPKRPAASQPAAAASQAASAANAPKKAKRASE